MLTGTIPQVESAVADVAPTTRRDTEAATFLRRQVKPLRTSPLPLELSRTRTMAARVSCREISEASMGSSTSDRHLCISVRLLLNRETGAYKRLTCNYEHTFPTFTLSVDHVQADAYASPSKVRPIMPWRDTGLPGEYLLTDIRRIALCDFVTRVCADLIRVKHLDQNAASSDGGGGWSGPKGGAFNINAPSQEVLPRTSTMIDRDQTIELRFTTSLPAAGRTILGQQAHQILAVNLVELVKQSLLYANLHQDQLQQHLQTVENQHSLREQLRQNGLILFVANGSILPRASGASAGPMSRTTAVRFQSPKDLEITLPLADGTSVLGMGSTLLEAMQLGIYNHIPGDGRELVVTDPTAVKIRAEDGRSVSSTDISPFISGLPGGKDTKRFSTDDASGSTSMAANIQEALEVGCKTLLIDEDSSATNLLVRDQRMQSLIRNEPITPLMAKARALYAEHGVSTVIVICGLGDWLSVADHVIAMDSYVPRLITAEAKAIVNTRSFQVDLSGIRSPYAVRKNFVAMKPQDRNPVDDPSQGEAGIYLSGLDQIVEIGQSRTVASLVQLVANRTSSKALPLTTLLEGLQEAVDIDHCLPLTLGDGELVGVRVAEIAAALSRMRGVLITK
ncbi:Uu.00g058070.m01.CDS01 [Anthostomella pinea]|uniref:Uu.00g058070.m01.CDS01 n=1 Tax=Anthostomella pinea TaxID=933095 RepID=A0AAI8VRU1_9PEZI|nr:Uu.00g058070.m01.CDS01 [Anthostomella pinea]